VVASMWSVSARSVPWEPGGGSGQHQHACWVTCFGCAWQVLSPKMMM
jgi:hypothetical protein